jgi:uncharacterized protein (DUF2147 family)
MQNVARGQEINTSGDRRQSMFQHIRWRALLCYAATIPFGLILSSASATPTTSPIGTWSTANGHGVIAIEQCGDALCGRIVGIDRRPKEPMPTDGHGRSQCGLIIITNQQPTADASWLGSS